MSRPFRLFCTHCLRTEPVGRGPGQVVVVLDQPLVLQGPGLAPVITLNPGDILFSDPDAKDVADAVGLYLHGAFDQSDLRFGVALILGMDEVVGDPSLITPEHERLIDHWLDDNTAFAYTVYTEDGYSAPDRDLVGILNDVRRNWCRVRASNDQN